MLNAVVMATHEIACSSIILGCIHIHYLNFIVFNKCICTALVIPEHSKDIYLPVFGFALLPVKFFLIQNVIDPISRIEIIRL